jgi:hypothetical protein
MLASLGNILSSYSVLSSTPGAYNAKTVLKVMLVSLAMSEAERYWWE